jgi:NitT/TauT family transport system permease protein
VRITDDPLAAQEVILETTAVRRRRQARGAARAVLFWIPPLLTFALLIALWHLATIAFGWEKFIVPTPPDVAHALWDARDQLPSHVWATLLETLEGYALAIAVGVPLAVAIAYSRILERSIYPVLVAVNAVPKIAIAPILILWMGFGAGPKIVMVFLICFFPIVLSTATGLQSTPPELSELIRSLSASHFQMFWKVRFPAALPQIFVGLKVAITLAVIGAVIGEFVGASEGLGYVIIFSQGQAQTPLAFGAIVLLSVLSIALFYSVVAVERLLIPWAQYEQR